MARQQTLEDILNLMRAEARLSLSPAMNVQVTESHKLLLKREQERLWEDYAWPHMRVEHTMPLQAGQYLYDLPAGGDYTLTMDRVERIAVNDGGIWRNLCPEITDAHYSTHETALDDRSWPVRNWRATHEDQIEVWPIPDTNGDPATLDGYLKVVGIRSLNSFVADNDRADLDDHLIALYVAAGVLAAQKAPDAQLKLEAANKLYTKLKGKQTKTTSFNLFGTTQRAAVRRGPPNFITKYVP